jgi:hypothetical protein
MFLKRRLGWTTAAGVAFVLYGFAVWCEAAYEPADIGFSEVLSWTRMIGALGVTEWSDVQALPPQGRILESIAVIGMIGAIVGTSLRHSPTGRGVRAAVWGYSLLLILAGGWISLLALLINLPQIPPDGEFLADNGARFSAIGIWTALCLYACWAVRPAHAPCAPFRKNELSVS